MKREFANAKDLYREYIESVKTKRTVDKIQLELGLTNDELSTVRAYGLMGAAMVVRQRKTAKIVEAHHGT